MNIFIQNYFFFHQLENKINSNSDFLFPPLDGWRRKLPRSAFRERRVILHDFLLLLLLEDRSWSALLHRSQTWKDFLEMRRWWEGGLAPPTSLRWRPPPCTETRSIFGTMPLRSVWGANGREKDGRHSVQNPAFCYSKSPPGGRNGKHYKKKERLLCSETS